MPKTLLCQHCSAENGARRKNCWHCTGWLRNDATSREMTLAAWRAIPAARRITIDRVRYVMALDSYGATALIPVTIIL